MQTTLLLLVAAVLGTHALDTGAPYDACVSMTPQHGTNKPQTSPSPYEIQITPLEDGQYGVKVFINNETVPDFRGVFVQARRVNSTLGLSYFDGPKDLGLRLRSCSNTESGEEDDNGFTHADNNLKTSAYAVWNAGNVNLAGVRFEATVVKNFTHFWTGIRSANIQ